MPLSKKKKKGGGGNVTALQAIIAQKVHLFSPTATFDWTEQVQSIKNLTMYRLISDCA
jgi:hypothetical protein